MQKFTPVKPQQPGVSSVTTPAARATCNGRPARQWRQRPAGRVAPRLPEGPMGAKLGMTGDNSEVSGGQSPTNRNDYARRRSPRRRERRSTASTPGWSWTNRLSLAFRSRKRRRPSSSRRKRTLGSSRGKANERREGHRQSGNRRGVQDDADGPQGDR
jgi:hypothetical protein